MQIDKYTCRLIGEHMVEHGSRDTDLLFTSTAGTALSRNHFCTKFWVPAVEEGKPEHGCPSTTSAPRTHTSSGADIVVVQVRLGHRCITSTQQYTGTLPDAGARALAAFRKIRYPAKAPAT